ncbi:Obg family GTPase CgtA [Buchnera aphidicola]|nr:Obg family GTPase CgtA [Buchnera aphidicola]
MKFIDKVIIHVKAGNGGDGCISFRREKNVPKGGPDGGDGGDGGNIWLKTSKNVNTLAKYTFKNNFTACNGQDGKNKKCSGKKGNDTFILVPVGTKISDNTNQKLIKDMTNDNQTLLIAKGGWHGIGNYRFKTSTNRTPRKRTLGTIGEIREIKLELILLAEVGTLGLPNSGKSTFIKNISNAKPKIGNYPFTTLFPSLAVVNLNHNNRFVIADIPGIIKGASKGLGLGLQMLKHLERCKILLHIIDISSNDNLNLIRNIQIIINELKQYSKKLYDKPKWLIFNKIDLVDQDKIDSIAKKINEMYENKFQCHFISALQKKGLNTLCYKISQSLKSF